MEKKEKLFSLEQENRKAKLNALEERVNEIGERQSKHCPNFELWTKKFGLYNQLRIYY